MPCIGNRQSHYLGARRVKIHQFNQRRRSTWLHAKDVEDQRDAYYLFVQVSLLPESVFAQVVAVVGGENDRCRFTKPKSLKFIHDSPELLIHETDRRVTRLPHPLTALFSLVQPLPSDPRPAVGISSRSPSINGGSSIVSGGYKSKNFLGCTIGKWGGTKPIPRKNGLPAGLRSLS